MTDPLRTNRLPNGGDVPERDRDARIEELLLIGLDHYFLGRHERAISVWTRVLFLDRGHARARAYIERARGAIAERQRESEELLHTGVAAFDRGDTGAARRLLTSAVERGAASEEAVALLERLDRLETVIHNGQSGDGRSGLLALPPDQPSESQDARPSSRLAWIATGVCAGIAVAALAAWLWTGAQGWWVAQKSASTPAVSPAAVDPLPLPSSAEAAFARAQRLHEGGRLHDALEALAGIRHGDPWRPRADALRAAIQSQLLESSHAGQQQAGVSEPPDGPAQPDRTRQ
jgi:tetratricopeptide (TPR) repeat protein